MIQINTQRSGRKYRLRKSETDRVLDEIKALGKAVESLYKRGLISKDDVEALNEDLKAKYDKKGSTSDEGRKKARED
jgi:hypothetical protein